MTDKDKIRAFVKNKIEEIGRMKIDSLYYNGIIFAFKEVEHFIGSLSKEPVSEDLDEAARNHAEESLTVKFPTTDIETLKKDVIHIFKSGAKWDANQGVIYEDKIVPTSYNDEPDYCLDGKDEFELITQAVKDGILKEGDKVIVQIRKKEE